MTFKILDPSRPWSPQQIAFFQNMAEGAGHTVLDARAGCGKTTTILEGVNYVPETFRQILFVAFNKVIAEELKTRIRNPRASARTLHSLGNGIVFKVWGRTQVDDRRGHKLALRASGLRNPPSGLIPAIAKLAALGKNMAPFADVGQLMEIASAFGLAGDLEDVQWASREETWNTEMLASAAAEAMLLATERDGYIDYDDMIFLPVRMKWVRPQFDMVLVDECQDMNATQIILARGVCKANGRIIVVGDPHQAIYAFRGADSGSMGRLEKELGATRLGLTTTYRCPKKIVDIAQKIVPDFQAAPEAPEGIVRHLSSDKVCDEAAPGDFILSRKNAPLAAFCLTLLRMGKRAVIRGRDIGRSLVRIVEKMEATTIVELIDNLGEWETATVNNLVAEDTDEAKIELVQDQAATIRNLCEGLVHVAELKDRLSNLFSENNVASSIVCSSIHKSKGLESNRVYLLADTLYPRGRTGEEERNIHYVGVTRAKRELVIVAGDEP
jgi:superfamily I DNA/RNA helicase